MDAGGTTVFSNQLWTASRGDTTVDDSATLQLNNAKGFRFSGSVPHAVEAYLGERFSLVFYTTFSNRVLPEFHERALRQLGFPLPPPRPPDSPDAYGLLYHNPQQLVPQPAIAPSRRKRSSRPPKVDPSQPLITSFFEPARRNPG